MQNAVYGVYHPDYDAHVYRRIRFNRVVSEPINRAHDDESVQYGTFTYDVSNNGTLAVPFRGSRQGGAIHVNKGSGTGTFSGSITIVKR